MNNNKKIVDDSTTWKYLNGIKSYKNNPKKLKNGKYKYKKK